MTTTLDVEMKFGEPGYVESPYWPETYQLIEIQKKSGMNRARTDSTRRKALEQYLKSIDMTLTQYRELEVLAKRPFHQKEDGEIYIPYTKILACLVNANDEAPRAIRVDNIRSAVVSTDFVTGKYEPDGLWERFAVVNLATGRASNQRAYRSDHYIKNFSAVGTLNVEESMVDPEALLALLEYAGRAIGIGASRKMAWGRFTL